MKYYMSLGSDCSVALYLRDKELRSFAFPFDWCVTPMRSVLELLDNKFEGFLDEENLVFMEPAHRKAVNDEDIEGELVDDIITPVYCKRYDMLIPHDFSKAGRDDLKSVQEKYSGRIERMYEMFVDQNNSFVFVANDAPTAPTSWRAARWREAGNKDFINDFENWQSRAKSSIGKYAHPRVINQEFITLQQLKTR